MPAETEFRGRSASEGVFIGPIAVIDACLGEHSNTGSPEKERQKLENAIVQSIGEISGLMEGSGNEAADILSFQIAMLEDEVLRGPALLEITRGSSAGNAWSIALDAEIVGYELSGDEYFRARSADLKDIRDRVLRCLSGSSARLTEGGSILVGNDIAPSLFLETDWSKGGAIALAGGSPTSHVAMLARNRGVPMIVGLGDINFTSASEAVVDGGEGVVILDPDELTRSRWKARAERLEARRREQARLLNAPARLGDGTPIEVLANVAGVGDLEHLDISSCDGIGLMRSEFLFRDGAPLPDEESQYRAYRKFLEWAGPKSVTIRTLDIGGDKPVRGLTVPGEKNPFLGLRGIRLMLARPDVFRVQLRALCRAAVHGNLKIMLPMVTVSSEIDRTLEHLGSCLDELAAAGVPARRAPVGIMVEVPAVALAPELFAQAEFFSIGSNDLTQYVTASSRDDASVSGLNDPSHPAVLRLISEMARFGQECGKPISVCGDMASEPRHLPSLVAAGIRTLSVAPARLAQVKSALVEI